MVGRRGGPFLYRVDRETGWESVRAHARALALESFRRSGAEGETSEGVTVRVVGAYAPYCGALREHTSVASENRLSLLLPMMVKTCVTRLESSRVGWELVA